MDSRVNVPEDADARTWIDFDSSQAISRKQERRNKRLNTPETAESSSNEGEARVRAAPVAASLRQPSPIPMTAARALPLLVCSIGNPGSAYANTLHSAGHTVLNRLATHLGASNFQKERSLGNGLVSRPASSNENPGWTLWQSTAYMNDSGKGVRSAWNNWSRTIPDGQGRLVVIYDELERALGSVTVRTKQGASAKGHNGLKSIMAVMGDNPFVRIGVGIGRPESRQSDDVARYVLGKMTAIEKAKIEGAIEEVVRKLQELERG